MQQVFTNTTLKFYGKLIVTANSLVHGVMVRKQQLQMTIKESHATLKF